MGITSTLAHVAPEAELIAFAAQLECESGMFVEDIEELNGCLDLPGDLTLGDNVMGVSMSLLRARAARMRYYAGRLEELIRGRMSAALAFDRDVYEFIVLEDGQLLGGGAPHEVYAMAQQLLSDASRLNDAAPALHESDKSWSIRCASRLVFYTSSLLRHVAAGRERAGSLPSRIVMKRTPCGEIGVTVGAGDADA